jgi:hypothetical protein
MVLRRVVGLVAVFIACGMLPAPSAQAATIISVVATGTVTESADPSLLGVSMSIEQRFTVDPAQLYPGTTNSLATFATLQVSVTLGSWVYVYASTGATSAFGLYAVQMLDGLTPASVDAQSTIESGGDLLLASALVQSSSGEVAPDANLLQNLAFPPFPSGSTLSFGFSLQDAASGDIYYWASSGRVTSLTVTVSEVTIPAPAAFGLMAFGLAGLVVLRRRSPQG